MPLISIITPCYNEEENVKGLYEEVKALFAELPGYKYEHIFIDNSSTDSTASVLKGIAAKDKNAKVIINARNFGHIRSPIHALLQSTGDAAVILAADFQDPPSMIKEFIQKWEEGFKIVVAVKAKSDENRIFFLVRKAYYSLVSRLSDIQLIKNFTGFGLYDKRVIEVLRLIDDPYPYFRGLICDIGFKKALIPYSQPARKRGFTKNNLYTLIDMGLLGIINHSKIPLRMATIFGFIMSALSFLLAMIYLILKFLLWYHFPAGTAPILIGLFFFSSVQLFFIGVVGEYVGSIYTQVQKRPLVIEQERINFD